MDKKTSSGLQENIASCLCYVLGWITGLIFILIEKDNKTVRFHAMQSIVLYGAIFVAHIIIGTLMTVLAVIHLAILIPLLGLIQALLWLASIVLWIVLMIKAYQGEKLVLPVVGDIASNNI